MKVGVLIGSITGNTEHFAHVIMDELKKQDPTLTFEEYLINVEMNKKNTQADYEYPNCDAYLIGASTEAFGIPVYVRQYLESMPFANLKKKYVLTFSTCAGKSGHLQFAIEQILIALQALPVTYIQCIYPGNYVQFSKVYAKQIQQQILLDMPAKCALFVNSLKTDRYNFQRQPKGCSYELMYKVQHLRIPIKFIILDDCTGCGVCVQNCPSGILRLENNMAVFTEQNRCLGCFACFQKCPVKAVVDPKRKLSKVDQYHFNQSYIIESK
ncbi:4Fe-4S_ferredoxin iron-sulfur binding domain protein [Hexamita inflata]|uniref:4Fe-4S ferredoxin iron-sulfur binding domain protein n=1 Tax=Hexamita inflata TaxID=28002 RepID=A0AA86R9S1_9EUKA|nr:4Fe-4S ferredoxin iron-sulfur binding domain protein [Hexamita inflata]